MVWIFHVIIELCATVVAYLTNPIVVLFCDEKGDLPEWAKWWQTYDNCLDIDWMVYEHCVPKFAEYDFNKHYKYVPEVKGDYLLIPGHVEILDPNFTLKERFQRYVCRVCWLYRNCNYGFSYYVNGRYIDSAYLVVLKDIKEPNNEQFLGYYDPYTWYDSAFKRYAERIWCCYYCKQYCKWFRLRIYLGWKLKGKSSGVHMLALHISPFKPVEK